MCYMCDTSVNIHSGEQHGCTEKVSETEFMQTDFHKVTITDEYNPTKPLKYKLGYFSYLYSPAPLLGVP